MFSAIVFNDFCGCFQKFLLLVTMIPAIRFKSVRCEIGTVESETTCAGGMSCTRLNFLQTPHCMCTDAFTTAVNVSIHPDLRIGHFGNLDLRIDHYGNQFLNFRNGNLFAGV